MSFLEAKLSTYRGLLFTERLSLILTGFLDELAANAFKAVQVSSEIYSELAMVIFFNILILVTWLVAEFYLILELLRLETYAFNDAAFTSIHLSRKKSSYLPHSFSSFFLELIGIKPSWKACASSSLVFLF